MTGEAFDLAVVGAGPAGVAMDSGILGLRTATDAKSFLAACRKLRFWEREAKVQVV